MKATGIVRKLDQLGRIVVPMSLRKSYDIREGDPIEIFVKGDTVILEKYKPKCVFCMSTDLVVPYREKSICSSCLTEINHSFA